NFFMTTARPTYIIDLCTKGAFGKDECSNKVDAYDVLWVSPEINANLSQPYMITMGGGANAVVAGTVLDAVMRFIPARAVRQTFALSGNEFLGYQRRPW
ncbi:major capsid protein, partial [Pseudomonas aeruginosa]